MKTLLIFLIVIITGHSSAQDIRGAYIRTNRVSGFTYSISVTLFTDVSQNITRPTIPINFGDATSGTFTLSVTSNVNGINVKTYSGTHTYAGNGAYMISYLDTFRITGIKNIQNSQTQQIYLESIIYLNNLTNNSSPIISVYPLNFGVSGNQVTYNPSCNDIDGDSISYSLINCAPSNYYLPSNANINNSTGTFSFSKDSIGLYAFCIKIHEWKKNPSGIYTIIGTSQIDFVIDITTTLGINENALKSLKVFVYPNPFKDKIKINSDYRNFINNDLSIINILGQIVYSSNIIYPEQELDLSFLASGIYYLKIQNNSDQKVFKIIKE
jgi:hypothetical protein